MRKDMTARRMSERKKKEKRKLNVRKMESMDEGILSGKRLVGMMEVTSVGL